MARATTELWSLGGIPMSVERDSEDTPVVRMGELGPLDSSRTILHYGGTESYDRELTAVMWSYSGYVNEFTPIVGSGYHTLVSDVEDEGNYFVVSCKPERLHDFIQCSGNSPVRMNIKLKKDNPTPAVGIKAYVGTAENGIYYCSDLQGPTGNQAVWSVVNAGLGNYIYSIKLELDPFDSNKRQYFLTGDIDSIIYHGSIFRRENQGNWTSILTPSEAATTIGETNVLIYDIASDEANDGYLYAGVYDSDNENVWVILSTNYGDTWAPVKLVAGSILYVNEYWNMLSLKVYGNQIFVNIYNDTDSDTTYYISSDGGSTFTPSSGLLGFNFSDNPVFFNALQTTPYFGANKATTYNTLCRFVSPNQWETVIPAIGLGSDHLYYIWDEQVWGSSNNVGTYSAIDYSGSPDVLHYTTNSWSTYDTVNLGNNLCRMHWRDPDDENIFFFGADPYSGMPHGVYTSDDYGVTLDGRAGPNPDSAPYTDSIPYIYEILWGCFKPYKG